MNVTTKPAAPATPVPPPTPDFDAEREAAVALDSGFPVVKGSALYDAAASATNALDEVDAIAKLALCWLETADGQGHTEVVAVALRAIWSRASDASELIGDIAEDAGISVKDERRSRRIAAARELRDRWIVESTQERG